jgi:dimethylhistidine N-methyltransferase
MAPSRLKTFLADVVEGLSRPQKTLSCRWLYDDRGSCLFEAITALPEYYLSRTEVSILWTAIGEISTFVGRDAAVIEYGAGAALKTEILFGGLETPRLYVPVDIARDFLQQSVHRFSSRFPTIRVLPIAADFMYAFPLPEELPQLRRVAFFPGSTIGNLTASQAKSLLCRMRNQVGKNGVAIIGVDIKKEISCLLAAYDDKAGVTAEFNLNLIVRINRELGGNFNLDGFRHEARWNAEESAIEMHIVSQADQTVRVGDTIFSFVRGETIHTESSRKYDMQDFASLAAECGWDVAHAWTNPDRQFAVFGLRAGVAR